MCTTCSECVAHVYIGVKTHLCIIHTRPCCGTSAHNTYKVHVTLTAKKMNICIYLHTYVYACICTRKHMRMHAYTYVCRCIYMFIFFAVSVTYNLQVFWALVHGQVCMLHRCGFTPTYTSANTLAAGCTHMCICKYMCVCVHMHMDAYVRL